MNVWQYLWLLLIATPLWAGDIEGKLQVVDHRDRPENLEPGTAIVYLHGLTTSIPDPLLRQNYEMIMEKKQFAPQLMIIPRGATVVFPNMDPIIHNVFSVSGPNRFDAGSYAKGEGKAHTFDHDGMVRIFCNVHHSMNAIIYVTDNPYFATVGEDGRFMIENVPPGEYELRVLHFSGSRSREQIRIGEENMQLDVQLKLLKPRPLRHLNKKGKPYKSRRSRRY